jgi:isoleucyl-tRNA synthetase
MKGYDVRFQNGFDCQGLWVEVEVEKELGFKNKKDIEAYGISEFVKRCKQRVLKYAAIQTEQSIRLGMWTDWNDPDELRKLSESLEEPMKKTSYKGSKGEIEDTAESLVGKLGNRETGGSYFTFSDDNNYTIWRVLKKCHEKGWIYKGSDSMPWCPRCSTGISQHEIVTEGYRELTHTSLYVRFPLRNREGSLLIWTTTPWTLTSNVAVAVHPELEYVKISHNGEILYLSKGTLDKILPKGNYRILEEMKGHEFEGWTYNGPFDDLEIPKKIGVKESHVVIFWEDVSETEGTGMVHIAPGAGKEDLELGKEYGLPTIAPLDEFGIFLKGFGILTGTNVYDSAETILEILREKGILLKEEDYTHRYPVCWRCGSELVFRFVEEWFISMGEKFGKPIEEISKLEKEDSLRYQIMDSACQTRWIPDFGLKRELDWLQNMDDWMISKKRYWGLALPIWTCEKCDWFDVIGSKEELKKRTIEGWDVFDGHSPHRPYLDSVKIKCGDCGSTASRIPDVGNPWLDAGIVTFSTLDYMKDREYWEKWFPADFISECYIGQFRNWFYSMLAMSTILERQTPYKVCLGHGMVLAEDGRQMHKSWGNAIWLEEAAEKMGVDVMRWMFCSTKPENDLLFGYSKANEVKRLFFMPLANIFNFFVIYANLDKWTPRQKSMVLSELDRWILSKLNNLIDNVTSSLDEYDVYSSTREIENFVDVLSTWYIRRSRRRFWKSEADQDKEAAYSTLYNCIKNIILLMAPITPFISEALYQRLIAEIEPDSPKSVHLCPWPVSDKKFFDDNLIEGMDIVLKITSLGRAARNRSGIKLRQPLREALVIANQPVLDKVKEFQGLIKDEINVKNLKTSTKKNMLFKQKIRPNPKILGKKHGKNYGKVVAELLKLNNKDVLTMTDEGRIKIHVNDFETIVSIDEVDIESEPLPDYVVVEEMNLIIGIDTRIDKDLEQEGLARDLVRRIQSLRKDADFEIDDYIETYYSGDEILERVMLKEREYISVETLSRKILKKPPPEDSFIKHFDIDGKKIVIGLKR